MAHKSDLGSTSTNKTLDMEDKESLDREFGSFCRNLDSIRTQVFDSKMLMVAEAITKSSKETMANLFSCLDEIMQSKKNLEDQAVRTAEMKELIEKVNALEENKTALESEMETKQKKLKDENEKFGALTEDLKALEKVTTTKKEKMSKALAFFRERIGLRFEALKSEDQMKVIFDKIDGNNLEREFSFYTKVIDSKYIISQCEPPIMQLDSYIEELNKTSDFGKFIHQMRKAFKNIVLKENDQNTPVNILNNSVN